MKKKRKSLVLMILALALIMGLTPCMAFASTSTVPANLTAPAASLDVSVTDKITMTAAAGESDMTVSDVTVTNNASMGLIALESVAYGSDVDPWSLTLDSEDFKSMGKDLHKFSLTADGQDLKIGSKTYADKQIGSGASYTVTMEGKTGISTTAVSNVHAGNVILTLAMVTAGSSGSGSGSGSSGSGSGSSGSSVKIVSWADGTDEQIVAMVKAADAGKINLADYWHVGDTRTVHLSAMSATNVGESHAEQDIQLVLMHAGGYELADGSTCNFVVGQKDALAESGYMHSNRNSVSWDDSARRAWCNNEYKNAMPESLSPIFKQFKTITAETYNGTTLKTSLDYFALPAEREVFGPRNWSNSTEINALFKFDWYQTEANRIKKLGISGNAASWWERSPFYGGSSFFCNVGSDGNANFSSANGTLGLAPFGCI